MKTLLKTLSLAILFSITFLNVSMAQIGGDTYEAKDANSGDLDQLEKSVTVCVSLETILILHAPKDPSVCFVFDEMEEFKKGIKAEDPTNGGSYISKGVTNGIHEFSVDATVNWKLDWRADIEGEYVEGANTSSNRQQLLAIDNVGGLFSTGGTNDDYSGTLNELIVAEDAVALSDRDYTIVSRAKNTSNIGDAGANNFRLAWRVGTQESTSNSIQPSMNSKSLLEQQIGSERFKFDVIFTLSQDDPWIQ